MRSRPRPRAGPAPTPAWPAWLAQCLATWPSRRGRGPRSWPAPWSGAGPWGSRCCCCSAPRCPRGRAPRKVQTTPPSLSRLAGSSLQEPAFLRRPFSPRLTLSPWLRPSSGEIDWLGQSLIFNPRLLPMGSVTPTLCWPALFRGWRGSS